MRVTKGLSIVSFCLMLIPALAGVSSSAMAQQREKRIALVVGNGAYAKSPLATAANDAGLIAQTLQAAGFDVVGARDLDGDTLRKSFRDFIQKAQASEPGTVAMVYLAGYGVQLAGENYFIPVDSSLSRDVDIPVEGLRISDYMRQLASLPLKASVVVLDAARQQPFIEGGGQQIASGLALVEPGPHMLIAFNAAPGTVAPNEPGPYGVYAQALAEMIRTGGLPLQEVVNRVRLRVNEASKGAQVPWHAEKIDAQFMFFDRAPDAPAPAPQDQVAAIRSRPIRDLGAQDAYAAAIERDSMQGYEDFLATYPTDPLAKRVRALAAARREALTWQHTYRTDTPQAYWSYLRRYPRGPHAGDARRRLAILTAPLEPPPAFAVIDYDVPPPPPDEIVYVDRPVLAFSDPEFDFAPPPPVPVFFLPPPPPDFVVLEPPPPPIGLFILPQPLFVPMPVYVQAPVYVVPPPNNVIFANIHNTTVINTVINQPPQQQVQGPPGTTAQPGSAQPAAAPPGLGAKATGPGAAPPAGAGPALPPAVAQRATLIQQGKLPVPPSAAINPAAKSATPGQKAAPAAAVPANVAPNALPPSQALPKANALPVPGTKGVPSAPPSAAGPAPGATNPNAKLAPQVPPVATAPATAAPPKPAGAADAPKPSGPNLPASQTALPKTGHPGPAPAANPLPGSKPVGPAAARNPAAVPPPPPPKPPAPAPTAVAKPAVQPQIKHIAPPPPRSAPQVARPTSTPPRVSSPPPPARVAAPPPRPAPPPQIARPAPSPPPARPAPPPQIARPAPPPPPRPAPPPPRPAPAAAAKKCPPNVPRC